MKQFLASIGGACVIAVAVLPVHAADLPLKAPPVPVAYSWAGFYIGGNVGVDWSNLQI
jgi:opacity protein-like surface antigen